MIGNYIHESLTIYKSSSSISCQTEVDDTDNVQIKSALSLIESLQAELQNRKSKYKTLLKKRNLSIQSLQKQIISAQNEKKKNTFSANTQTHVTYDFIESLEKQKLSAENEKTKMNSTFSASTQTHVNILVNTLTQTSLEGDSVLHISIQTDHMNLVDFCMSSLNIVPRKSLNCCPPFDDNRKENNSIVEKDELTITTDHLKYHLRTESASSGSDFDDDLLFMKQLTLTSAGSVNELYTLWMETLAK
jgi:hypothetical protein